MKTYVDGAVKQLITKIENAKHMKAKHKHEFCEGEEPISYWNDQLADLEYKLARIKLRFRRVEFQRSALASLYSKAI